MTNADEAIKRSTIPFRWALAKFVLVIEHYYSIRGWSLCELEPHMFLFVHVHINTLTHVLWYVTTYQLREAIPVRVWVILSAKGYWRFWYIFLSLNRQADFSVPFKRKNEKQIIWDYCSPESQIKFIPAYRNLDEIRVKNGQARIGP